MGWFWTRRKPPSPDADAPLVEPTEAELRDLMKDYFEVQKDEGATGRPEDYAATLQYVPPSNGFPEGFPGDPLCGCCSAPFSLIARRDGLWMAAGKKDPRPVPLCAVCITHLNARAGQAQFPLPRSYDEMGQQLAAKFGTESVQKVAVTRIALIRMRRRAAGL